MLFRCRERHYIFKLQERIEKEENLTLESPDVRPQINEMLVNNRKQLLAASYQAIAMNEAKIENLLAKRVVDNPNELSGARPASTGTPSPGGDNTRGSKLTPANRNRAGQRECLESRLSNRPTAANANKPK